jgi:hypothetical protein
MHADRNLKLFILSVSEGKTFASYKRAMSALFAKDLLSILWFTVEGNSYLYFITAR